MDTDTGAKLFLLWLLCRLGTISGEEEAAAIRKMYNRGDLEINRELSKAP